VHVLKETKNPSAKIDPAGIVTFTIAAGALTYGLIRAADEGWGQTVPLVSFGVAVVALVVFILIERARAYPMLDLKLFTRPAFTGLMIGALTIQAGAFSAMAYTSIWLQSVLGLGPIEAGAIFLPMSLVSLVCSVLTGRLLHDRLPAGLMVGIGVALVALGSGLQAFVSSGSSWLVIWPGIVAIGVGVGIAMPTLSSAVLAAAPRERGGMAGGAVNMFRQLGYVLGIAVFGSVFANRVEATISANGSMPDPGKIADLLTGGQARVVTDSAPAAQRGVVDDLIHQAFADGLRWTYLVAAAVALVGAVLTLVLTRTRRASESSSAPAEAASIAG
jgi:MFS family permease